MSYKEQLEGTVNDLLNAGIHNIVLIGLHPPTYEEGHERSKIYEGEGIWLHTRSTVENWLAINKDTQSIAEKYADKGVKFMAVPESAKFMRLNIDKWHYSPEGYREFARATIEHVLEIYDPEKKHPLRQRLEEPDMRLGMHIHTLPWLPGLRDVRHYAAAPQENNGTAPTYGEIACKLAAGRY